MAFTLPENRTMIQGGVYQGRGVGWPSGVDSFNSPLFVHELQVRWTENAVNQGGMWQTRPGYKSRYAFDTTSGIWNSWWLDDGQPIVHPQMLVRFQPTNGGEQLVFAVSGSVFWAPVNPDGSIGPPTLISTFQFNQNADLLIGVRCVQSATIIAGLYANNIAPRNLLVIQDGVNRAGIWDGMVGVHMNPVKMTAAGEVDSTLYPEAFNQTRIGLWMAWSGNRLWIANGKNVYASDLNDPTHFTEELRRDSAPSFTFPDDVSGMTDRGTSGTNRSQVVVFTPNSTWTLWSGIQARLPTTTPVQNQGWAFTPDFLSKIFDGVGCVAGKSVIVHRGLLYWKSQGGMVLFDNTSTVNSTQNIPPIDQEMAYSKLRVAPSSEGEDLTCVGKLGSYVWWSVPVGKVFNGRRYCSQTQVLDRQTTIVRSTGASGAFNAGTTGWQGVWTGIRPVEWANVSVGGVERTYALSLDSSGIVRIWEGFQANRADNGQRIPWYVETRVHPVQPTIFEYANFHHFRLLLDQIYGNLDIVGYWRGLKGNFHELLTTQITATPGSLFTPVAPYNTVTSSTMFHSFAMQGRTVISRTQENTETDCTAQNVESPYQDAKDHAFSLAISFRGRGALTGYVLFADTFTDNTEGQGVDGKATGIVETGFNIVPEGGCPVHIDGVTPDYVALDEPPQLAVSPYQPVGIPVNEEYVAPV